MKIQEKSKDVLVEAIRGAGSGGIVASGLYKGLQQLGGTEFSPEGWLLFLFIGAVVYILATAGAFFASEYLAQFVEKEGSK